jgi:hypothetical protein
MSQEFELFAKRRLGENGLFGSDLWPIAAWGRRNR